MVDDATPVPDSRPGTQPAPFGCRYLVAAALLSFVFGIAGAFTENALTAKRPTPAGTSQQTVSVQESSSVIDAVKKVSPAVVSISFTNNAQSFFGPTEQKGGGTGFIITGDGLIATNKHVVEAARTLTVVTSDGKTHPAEVKAVDPVFDLALIKIDAKNLPVVALGDSDNLSVGQSVIAIGNALGEFENTVTTGVISAKQRSIQAEGSTAPLENLLQTDAAINPGNSGGPLVNTAGQVIGINTAVAAGGAQGIGFATPINLAKQAIDIFQQKGKIIRASLGVRTLTVTKDVARLRELPVDNGALVVGVVQGSAAEKTGFKNADVITAVDGSGLDATHSLAGLIGKHAPGDEVEVTIRRGKDEQKLKVKLDQR